MPTILFVHQNFPAQFGGIGAYLVRHGWRVFFASAAEELPKGETMIEGMHVLKFGAAREPAESTHRYLRGTEKATLNAQGFCRLALGLKSAGVSPDLVVAHSGWGSGSLSKVVWPDCKFIQYLEWWYNFPPVDVGVSKDNPEDQHAFTLHRNLPFLLDAQSSDRVLVPTQYQADQIPQRIMPPIDVFHDGVDCAFYHPEGDGDAPFDWEGLPEDARIVTYATRGKEPMRGFPEFMEALSIMQQKDPDLHCVIAGADTIHYSRRLPEGETYKDIALKAHEFDLGRVHFTGRLPRSRYAALLRRSNAHVYLSRPFVPSWSLVEAMASGCPLVISNTPGVTEIAPDETIAMRAPLDQPNRIAAAALELIDSPSRARRMGKRARKHAETHYASQVLYPAKDTYFRGLIANS